jgi:hypothetical protein
MYQYKSSLMWIKTGKCRYVSGIKIIKRGLLHINIGDGVYYVRCRWVILIVAENKPLFLRSWSAPMSVVGSALGIVVGRALHVLRRAADALIALAHQAMAAPSVVLIGAAALFIRTLKQINIQLKLYPQHSE